MENTSFYLDFLSTTTLHSPLSSIEIQIKTRYKKVYRRINGNHITMQNHSIMEPSFFTLPIPTHLASLPAVLNSHISSALRVHNIPIPISDFLARKIGSKIASLGHMGFHLQVKLKIVYRDFVDEAMEMETEEGVLIMDGQDLLTGSGQGSKGVSGFVMEQLKKQRFYLEGDELSDSSCAICLEEFSGEVSLIRMPACSHVFHQDCVFAWLKKSKTCPTCRHQISF